MHVLFVIREDADTILGGDTIQMRKTRAALEARGVTVTVCSTHQWATFPACDLAHLFNLQTADATWGALEILQQRGIPTVLSSIYWELYDSWFAGAAQEKRLWRSLTRLVGRRLARTLYVRWQRTRAPRSTEWQTQRRLLTRTQRVLPNSRAEAELLQRHFHLDAAFSERVDIIPNAIDHALYDPLPPPSQALDERLGVRDFVLEVGRISETKNQLRLIQALYDLPVPLVFVGQIEHGAYAQQCQELGKQRGNTIFLERMAHAELPQLYRLAKVHALPSWRETPGLVSLEAAGAGCRIVTTTIGSTREYFGDDAWYCQPDDLTSIRSAVEAALAAPQAPPLRERILRDYVWEKTADKTLAAYHKALASR